VVAVAIIIVIVVVSVNVVVTVRADLVAHCCGLLGCTVGRILLMVVVDDKHVQWDVLTNGVVMVDDKLKHANALALGLKKYTKMDINVILINSVMMTS